MRSSMLIAFLSVIGTVCAVPVVQSGEDRAPSKIESTAPAWIHPVDNKVQDRAVPESTPPTWVHPRDEPVPVEQVANAPSNNERYSIGQESTPPTWVHPHAIPNAVQDREIAKSTAPPWVHAPAEAETEAESEPAEASPDAKPTAPTWKRVPAGAATHSATGVPVPRATGARGDAPTWRLVDDEDVDA
ncbi:unnamed protein product [Mycena citricolor]|uniref:Uncharacterized protein n=1 Tax=Mycena citricolor TaxID=2018698 RepID=A0AAD2HHJ5_9AGAR|nr:unnamed protein product [Mycena citricolor]